VNEVVLIVAYIILNLFHLIKVMPYLNRWTIVTHVHEYKSRQFDSKLSTSTLQLHYFQFRIDHWPEYLFTADTNL
jgi:hypothetical protein